MHACNYQERGCKASHVSAISDDELTIEQNWTSVGQGRTLPRARVINARQHIGRDDK